MALRIAKRGLVPPFIVMDVMRAANERAAAGGDVLHLEVGQPSGQAPAAVLRAAAQAVQTHGLGYTEALGLPELRQAISAHYRDIYGAGVAPEQVVITTGSSGAFLLAFLSAFEAGDRVAVAAPGYPAYANILTALGVQVVRVPVGPDSRWQLTADLLRQVAGPLDGVIVASPSNPTGTVLDRAELTALAQWCDQQGVRLVSDEIYHGITYGQAAVTAVDLAPNAIIINSFSKYYAMTGWRLGWMVVPPDMVRAVECLQQNLFISPPTLAQLAACAAFECREELDQRVAGYGRNRDLLLTHLPEVGFDRLAPSDGAFYLYADISQYSNDSLDFCRQLLARTGVAITPGVDFDPLNGHNFVRFSYAGSYDTMEESLRRLRQDRG